MTQFPTYSIGMTLEDIEKQIIEYLMERFDGNKMAVALSLGVSLRTIDNKLKKYEEQKIVAKTDERKSLTAY